MDEPITHDSDGCDQSRSSHLLRCVRPWPSSLATTPRFLSTRVPLDSLRPTVKRFVDEYARLCQPDTVYVCDGSVEENDELLQELQEKGRLEKLPAYDNCYLALTSPADVARVEKQTYVCSEKMEETIPIPKEGVKSRLGNWMSPKEMDADLEQKFTGCMKGRTMFVIPFSMGPIGSPLSKIGIQLTDSAYVAASMRIMTRMGKNILDTLGNEEFIKCLHSVGKPLAPGQEDERWPCNPEKITIAHFPSRNEIKSFGSGYGGNSLLGKKCFALRIASTLARDEGWLAEHMLILGITNPEGKKKYIAAAFPSQCGKTNLAMISPTIPGWKAECVGDDIAWMKFDETGRLRAINPEYGFFGVCPGTSQDSNPNAMAAIFKDTIFTNVAKTSDGGVYWKDMYPTVPQNVSITSWLGKENWQNLSKEEQKATPAAHPNSRFCSPASNCPIMDPMWEDPRGVPIDAILFGSRRFTAIPLVYESFNWQHGVFVGASMRSQSTSAAADSQGVVNDPFAMKPFFGYSFAHYLEHWLSLEAHSNAKLPRIFHVNWFRKPNDDTTHPNFLWPGYGENSRVLEWIFRRCEGEDIARPSAIGLLPKAGSLNLEGLDEHVDMEAIFELRKDKMEQEVTKTERFFNEQLPGQLPQKIADELEAFRERVSKL